MRAVRSVVGRGVPLDRRDVDTDQIIPSEWLKRTERSGFGQGVFSGWRADPSFVLNDPRYEGATILIAGANFGCGSSREHAVWALEDHGFRAVVAPSFADIFRANALKPGLVPVELPAALVETLMDAARRDPPATLTVDVERAVISAPGLAAEFPLDRYTRWRLLEGLDDIGATERRASAIDRYEAASPSWLPRISAERHTGSLRQR